MWYPLVACCLLAVQGVIVFLALYILVLTLAGLVPAPRRRIVRRVRTRRRFAIVVAARDEEVVIGNMLDSVRHQAYPARLHDTFVVADNCTDRTAQIAAACGAVVYERATDAPGRSRRSKPQALQFLLEQIDKRGLGYDAYVVMDADNGMAPDFLDVINECLDRGCEIVQGFRASKNPDANWVARLDHAAEAVATLEQQGRVRLGLSARLSGSAMVFSDSFFEVIGGWNPTCLDEVAELMALAALHRFRICWCPSAVIFDEKVTQTGQLSRQRQRWFAGAVQAFRKYFLRMIWAGVRNLDFGALEQGVYLLRLQVPRNVLVAVCAVLLGLAAYGHHEGFILHWPVWAFLLGCHLLCFILALLVRRAPWRVYLALFLSPLFILAYLRALLGLLLRRPTPIRTEHLIGQAVDERRG